MFVKIVRGSHETVYECNSYHIQHDTDKPGIGNLHLEHRDDAPGESIEFHKAETSIYVMNNSGATINRYGWYSSKNFGGATPPEEYVRPESFDKNIDYVSMHTYANPSAWLGWIDVGSGDNTVSYFVDQYGNMCRFVHKTKKIDLELNLVSGAFKVEF